MATVVVDANVTEPCPSSRMPTNPTVSAAVPSTPAIATSTVPKAAPMTAMTRRTPLRSIRRPTDGNNAAPASVPMKYAVEICERDRPDR